MPGTKNFAIVYRIGLDETELGSPGIIYFEGF